MVHNFEQFLFTRELLLQANAGAYNHSIEMSSRATQSAIIKKMVACRSEKHFFSN